MINKLTNVNFKDLDFRIDFIGIGAAKSATTWVADCLRGHPDIYLPPKKELNYFNKFVYDKPDVENPNYGNPLEWYHRYFKDAGPDQVKGEYCPTYMKNENTAFSIFKYNPDIKILTLLRHPVERAYSSFLFQRQLGAIAESQFESAIEKRPSLLKDSLYYQQLKIYFNLFDERNIKILLYDDIRTNRRLFLQEIYSFLGVKSWFSDALSSRSNQTKTPRLESVNQMISGARELLQKKKLRWLKTGMRKSGMAAIAELIRDRINVKPMEKRSVLPETTRTHLADYFKEDIKQLEQLIQRDLSIWK